MNGTLREIANFVAGLYFQNKEIILVIALGMACGVISQVILPGKGFGIIMTILVGIAGCVIGKYFLVKYITFIDSKNMKIIVAGIAGTMVLSSLINLLRIGEPKHKDKTKWRNNT
jgi:uncharacterized membrane protein YeaQ/YmgE (transglycosylase-associated protein family)